MGIDAVSRLTLKAASGSRFQLIHHQETTRNLPLRCLRLQALLAVSDRRVAHVFMEEGAEGTEALESDFKANVRNSQVV